MLYRSNLVAIIGGGSQPKFAENTGKSHCTSGTFLTSFKTYPCALCHRLASVTWFNDDCNCLRYQDLANVVRECHENYLTFLLITEKVSQVTQGFKDRVPKFEAKFGINTVLWKSLIPGLISCFDSVDMGRCRQEVRYGTDVRLACDLCSTSSRQVRWFFSLYCTCRKKHTLRFLFNMFHFCSRIVCILRNQIHVFRFPNGASKLYSCETRDNPRGKFRLDRDYINSHHIM